MVGWRGETTDYVDSTPVIGDGGRVYMTSRDGYLYALDRDGFLEWELLIGDVFYASPALDADGTIYVASYAGNGESVVQAVDPEGVVQWSQILPGYNDASIAIGADGSILVGMHDHSVYALEEKAILANTAWPKFGYDPQQTHTVQWGLPVGDAAVLATFPTAEVTIAEWYHVDWIGLGWFRADDYPWINHLQHGWWWCGHATPESYWVYDLRIGWLYLSPAFPNIYYSIDRGAWLLHAEGSSVYANASAKISGRWFFDYRGSTRTTCSYGVAATASRWLRRMASVSEKRCHARRVGRRTSCSLHRSSGGISYLCDFRQTASSCRRRRQRAKKPLPAEPEGA